MIYLSYHNVLVHYITLAMKSDIIILSCTLLVDLMVSACLQLLFHQRGLSLRLSVYQQACQSLTDDYENVRLSAMKLIWVLSHLYPDRYHIISLVASIHTLLLGLGVFAQFCKIICKSTSESHTVKVEILARM